MSTVTWALIPCSKQKAAHSCPAMDMYRPSPLFRGAYRLALQRKQLPIILSARHGAISPPWREIAPYDETLRGMLRDRRAQWAADVLGQLPMRFSSGHHIASYLGRDYGEFLVPALREQGFTVEEPLVGMRIGERLAWFKRELGGQAL